MMGMKKNRWIIVICTILIGASILAYSVDRKNPLIDQDEAACIFSGYYLDLYMSGRWEYPDWRAFTEHAEHPPVGGYLFGIMLHSIGEPIKTIEPREFWFKNSLDPTYYSNNKFFTELTKRYSMRQVVAVRYMSAFFALLTAAVVMLILIRLAGFFEGIAGFALLMAQPSFVYVGTLATFDISIIFLSVLVLYLTIELQRQLSVSSGRACLLIFLIAVSLGLDLAAKISTYAIMPAMFIVLACMSRGRKKFVRGLLAMVIAIGFALCLAYLLDPAAHRHPIDTLIERVAWRADRVEIQQITSPLYKLLSLRDRAAYALYEVFFSRFRTFAFFLLFIGGIISAFCYDHERKKGVVLMLILTFYFSALMFVFLPLAWIRYVTAYLPFIILPEAMGAGFILYIIKRWSSLSPRRHLVILATSFIIIFMGEQMMGYIAPRHMPSFSADELGIAPIFGYSISQPGKNADLHRYLYWHFKAVGNEKRAGFQLDQLEKMGVKP